MTRILALGVVVGGICAFPSVSAAQSRNLLAEMQAYAAALGVTCEHCHSAPPGSGEPEPKKDIARQMIAMTRELNARVQAATGKPAAEATRVDCATCHRGVTIPKPLGQIITETLRLQDIDAAIAQYRELHTRHYGRGSYDFGEDALVNIARPLASIRPDDTIRLLELNLEFHPRSAKSYALMGFAYTRKFDDESAIAALEKAVELEPENGEYQGQLVQLKMFQRRR
jgi:tetratricopeptide (TPR) repeat protein